MFKGGFTGLKRFNKDTTDGMPWLLGAVFKSVLMEELLGQSSG